MQHVPTNGRTGIIQELLTYGFARLRTRILFQRSVLKSLTKARAVVLLDTDVCSQLVVNGTGEALPCYHTHTHLHLLK